MRQDREDLQQSHGAAIAQRGAEGSLPGRPGGGADAAFEELVRANAPRMLATAARILGAQEQAADAVQEAFIQAFRWFDRFRGECRPSTWLHRIVVNEALKLLRTRRRTVQQSIEELLPRFTGDGHRVVDSPPWRQSPDDLLERGETRETVHRCLARLPDDYRLVLLLRDVEELSTEDAANALRIRKGAVKTRLHRARAALREMLSQELIGQHTPA